MKRNLFYVAAFALTLLSCSQEDLTNKSGKDGVKQGVPFVGTSKVVTGENPASRTSLDYDRTARSMTYYWEPGDKLWLDDGNSAEGEITTKVASATFFLSGTYNAPNYTVYYPGKNATTYNGVTIQTAQTQTAPNSSSHIGEAGDCGVATANKKPSGGYSFSLDHKASYLCFLPRTTNVTETGWVLTSIKVTSNDNIAGSYTLSTTGLSGTGSSNEITLTVSNFDITNSETSQATNASYMVIAPGTHTLKVEYSVKNTVSGNTGTIVRNLDSKTYAANTLYPITVHLIQNTICGMQNRISGIIRQLLIMLMDYIQPQTIRNWLQPIHIIQFLQIKIDGIIRIHLRCLDLRCSMAMVINSIMLHVLERIVLQYLN